MKPIDELLSQGLPGTELQRPELTQNVPQAWKFWESNDTEWAVFSIVGDHISEADQKGVRAAWRSSLRPVFVAPNHEAIKAISPHYRRLHPFLVCEIAGRGRLIAPPRVPAPSRQHRRCGYTRVPRDLLAALIAEPRAPRELRESLRTLERQYHSIRRRSDSDEREEVLLLQYAARALDHMGLRRDQLRGAQMVRTLERGGLGARRDHFFHSFQNYFLGLLAILRLWPQFEAYRTRARLDWQSNPCNVWFLTAMWHDVGYAFQKVGDILSAAMGYQLPDETAIDLKESFLSHPETVDALRTLSSLLAHLVEPTGIRTGWMRPGPRSNLGQRGNGIHTALSENIRQSHGAFGAVRLYRDYAADLDKMEPASANVLLQTVYLASCSIPFHDWTFRGSMRNSCGECRIATVVLPFAALLAFVDSIQDDRRGLATGKEATLILEELLIRRPATVSARINIDALGDRLLLGKIVEAHDVLAALEQNPDTLRFEYPRWMAR